MEYTKELQQLGLTEQEAAVYTALLSLGRATGYALAKKCKIDRSGIYFVLQDLREKGLIVVSPHAHRHYYIAKEPYEFLAQKRNDLQNFERVIPEMMSGVSHECNAKTLHFEGTKNASKESLEYILQKSVGKHMYVFIAYSLDDNLSEQEINFVRKNINLPTKYNVTIQAIASDVAQLQLFIDDFKKCNWNMRLLSVEDFGFRSSFAVVGQFVRISSRNRNMSVVIENDEVADAFRQMFQMAWEKGK